MALDNIANEDAILEFDNQSGPVDIVYTGDIGMTQPGLIPRYSTNCKVEGKKIVNEKISWLWNTTNVCPHTSILYDFVAGGGTMLPSASFVKADGQFVIRENDTATCAGAWKLKVHPFTIVNCSCNVTMSDGGQGSAKGS